MAHLLVGCVSDKSGSSQPDKVKFGVPAPQAFKKGQDISPTFIEMFVYLSREGVRSVDIFRRPGRSHDLKKIVKLLSEAKSVCPADYSCYTIASVIKKFLLRLPGGILGPEHEEALLDVVDMGDETEQFDAVNRIVSQLPLVSQKLLSLVFGTWHTVVHHSRRNQMTPEALAKSVTGSLLHTCQDSPDRILKGSKVLELMISNFGLVNVFGRANIQFYADVTRSCLSFRDSLRASIKYPSDNIVSPSESELPAALCESQRCASTPLTSSRSADLLARFPAGKIREHGGEREFGSAEETRGEAGGADPPAPGHLRGRRPGDGLSHQNSFSAPEVRKKYGSVEERVSAEQEELQHRSTSRFSAVRQRQLDALRRRAHWFTEATPPSHTSHTHHGGGGGGAWPPRGLHHRERSPSLGLTSDSDSVFSDDWLGGASGGSFLSSAGEHWGEQHRIGRRRLDLGGASRGGGEAGGHRGVGDVLEEEPPDDVMTRHSSRKSRASSSSSRKSASAPGPGGYPDRALRPAPPRSPEGSVGSARGGEVTTEVDEGISSCEDTLDRLDGYGGEGAPEVTLERRDSSKLKRELSDKRRRDLRRENSDRRKRELRRENSDKRQRELRRENSDKRQRELRRENSEKRQRDVKRVPSDKRQREVKRVPSDRRRVEAEDSSSD